MAMNRKYGGFNRGFGIVSMTLIFFTKNGTIGMMIMRDHQVSNNNKPGKPNGENCDIF